MSVNTKSICGKTGNIKKFKYFAFHPWRKIMGITGNKKVMKFNFLMSAISVKMTFKSC